MSDFAVIPVIDLKNGLIVHARGGKRADYRPLETPLGAADEPIAISRALLAITQSPILYVADLDAIEETGNHFELCRELASALPDATLWIDAGFSNVSDCAFWLPLGAVLVIGSECLETMEAWQDISASFGESVVLSLDFDGEQLRGPQALLADASTWPARVIVMTLGRVGTGAGPDLDRLELILPLAEGRAVFAAGGVQTIEDIAQAERAGARGILLASALHSGAITENEIAALLRERRS